jgi:hypothetical protein
MTHTETLRLALEALEEYCEHGAIFMPITVRDAIKAALEAKDEPVAWIKRSAKGNIYDLLSEPDDGYEPVYTTPPQRKPLTEKELNVLGTQWHFNLLETKDKTELFAFARAIEAAHGIKGEA